MRDVSLEASQESVETEQDRREREHIPDDEAPDDIAYESPAPDPSLKGEYPTTLRYSPPQHLPGRRAALPPQTSHPPLDPPYHDAAWAYIYALSMAMMFSTAFIIYVCSPSIPRSAVGDALWTALSKSIPHIAFYAVVATGVSGGLLAVLLLTQRYTKLFFYMVITGVPAALGILGMHLLVMSYRGTTAGIGLQDRSMRWCALLTFVVAGVWLYTTYRRRESLARAIGVIRLSCRIIKDNLALIVCSMGVLSTFGVFTVVWIAMFERVLMRGKVGMSGGWVMMPNSWWLAGWFAFMWVWTWGVFSGIQRVITAATTSQWYFYRYALPPTPSRQVANAALGTAVTTCLGTICLSSFLSISLRLPLLALPRRVHAILQLFVFSLVYAPFGRMAQPMTLTFAGVERVPLSGAARVCERLWLLAASSVDDVRGGIGGVRESGGGGGAWSVYRLAKSLLSACRLTTSLTFGLLGWIYAARVHDHSLYGYIVGLVSGAVGWTIVGGVEGGVSAVVDAVFICYALDVERGKGEAAVGVGHCREAGRCFGEVDSMA
ncbi:hypothetical protein SAICODRAFT_56724 [Saitoella complicata NRRL Y-17804]|uniref:uncharacterized protein n=1 Tax=Saitoella complicata (strain BCRC 22490 / CBS 7301 / JCM 7358 / NBRC 10748 / NRRL Y-17804) TaxID=698492 RepID=UPI00086684DE|nr:uncharacterized protein SAICODRAFT_56724 [Saitoella complicata NRRL Y-17804]ODQ53274.1 hypothetical protein SAICODRAFT_56724 [Saitoella complicata NRRL Y-17804]